MEQAYSQEHETKVKLFLIIESNKIAFYLHLQVTKMTRTKIKLFQCTSQI